MIYIGVFILSVISLSQFFGAYHYFERGQDLVGTTVSLGSLLVFLMTMFYMAFRIYIEEKQKANLQVKVKVFDWVEEKIYGSQR